MTEVSGNRQARRLGGVGVVSRSVAWPAAFVLLWSVWASCLQAQQQQPVQEVAQEAAEQVGEAVDAAEEAAGELVAAGSEAVDNAGEAAQDAAQAVGDAASDAAGTVRDGAGGVVDEVRGRSEQAWNEMLKPMWERFVAAVPVAAKAILILLGFWIAAVFLGWLTTSLLRRTNLDNRLARDLGLGGKEKKDSFSIEDMAGTGVKWVVLLFGLVAFFNVLSLPFVAGPLSNILTRVTEAVPALLKAFAYLAIYWVVGTLLKMGITRALGAVGFDERAGRWLRPREVRGEMVGPSQMIGRIAFYVVLLFALPPFLEALGQESAVAPLQDMMTEFFAFLPNVVAAIILVFIGRIAATIVREIVSNFLAVVGGDELGKRFGVSDVTGGRRLSEVVGWIVYLFVLVPIVVAAVDVLGIEAISEPVRATLERLLAAIPLLFVAALVALVGFFIARWARQLVAAFLSGVGFDNLPNRLNLGFLQPKEGAATLSSIAGSVVMVVILLLTAQQALASLGLEQLSVMVGSLLAYLPRLVAGLVILLAALSLGTYVSDLVLQVTGDTGQGQIVSRVAQYAIWFLGFSMGFSQLGVADEILQVAVSAVLGGTALALALAFGLGGRENAKAFLDKHKIGG